VAVLSDRVGTDAHILAGRLNTGWIMCDRETDPARKEGIVKKPTYAICGSAMIVAAALARSFSDGGPEVAILLIVGLVTLIGSADLPQQKGRAQ
jgi:hypothetical protein